MFYRPRKLYLSGVDRSMNLLSETVSGVDEIQTRSAVSFGLIDYDEDLSIYEGQDIVLEETDEFGTAYRIFGGMVTQFHDYREGNRLYYRVSCSDYCQLADKVLVAEAFEGTVAGDIIRYIHTEKLDAEGVTVGHIEDGPATARSVFNWRKASVCMDELEAKTGIQWNIDFYKQLHFFSRSTFVAPWDIDANTLCYYGLTVGKDRTRYRNVQVQRPGDLETGLQVKRIPSPSPDGQSRVFTLAYRLARKPAIFITAPGLDPVINRVEVDPGDIGIDQLEEGKTWWWSKGSNTIRHDETELPLSAGSTVEVDFTGLWRRIFVVENSAEIVLRQEAEGGSGRHEYYEEKATLDTSEAVSSYVAGAFQKYGRIPTIVRYGTQRHGLRAGMVQNIELPSRGLSGDFFIDKVGFRANGAGMMTYDVSLIDGSPLGGWISFFKNISAVENFEIWENEIVDLMATFKESEMEMVEDVAGSSDAVMPFQFLDNDGFEWGRWQWLDAS